MNGSREPRKGLREPFVFYVTLSSHCLRSAHTCPGRVWRTSLRRDTCGRAFPSRARRIFRNAFAPVCAQLHGPDFAAPLATLATTLRRFRVRLLSGREGLWAVACSRPHYIEGGFVQVPSELFRPWHRSTIPSPAYGRNFVTAETGPSPHRSLCLKAPFLSNHFML